MGATWFIGIVVSYKPEVVPLTYLYAIMVAFQGTFIFLLLVLFSQSVRQAYLKAWRMTVNGYNFLTKHFGNRLSSLENVRVIIVCYLFTKIINKSTFINSYNYILAHCNNWIH